MRMLFLKHLLLVLPVAAIASATPDASLGSRDDISLIHVSGVSQDDIHMLLARQLDVDGIVDGIQGLLDPLLNLLRPASLQNIDLIVTQLASLLGDGGAAQTKELIDVLSQALSSDAFTQLADTLGPLLPTLIELLNSDTINTLKTILDNASILLTREVAIQLRDLANSIGPLIEYLIQIISSILELIFGGGSGGGGGSTTNPSATATQTDSPSAGETDSSDSSNPSLTLTMSDSQSATSTDSANSGWDIDLGLGSSSDDNEDSSTSPTSTSESGLDIGLDSSSSSSSDDTDTGIDIGSGSGSGSGSDVSSSSEDSDSPGTATSSDDPSFTGGATKELVRFSAAGMMGTLIAMCLL
ncbi:hypothetical protein BJX99DRAFT_265626 [Aspergillus californicus]